MVNKLTALVTLALVWLSVLNWSGEATKWNQGNTPGLLQPPNDEPSGAAPKRRKHRSRGGRKHKPAELNLDNISQMMTGNEFYSYFVMNYETLFESCIQQEPSSNDRKVGSSTESSQQSQVEWMDLLKLPGEERGKLFPLLQNAWVTDRLYINYLYQFLHHIPDGKLADFFSPVIPNLLTLLKGFAPHITETDVKYTINEKGYEILFQHLLPQILAVLALNGHDKQFCKLVEGVLRWIKDLPFGATHTPVYAKWIGTFLFSASIINERMGNGDKESIRKYISQNYSKSAYDAAISCTRADVKQESIEQENKSLSESCEHKYYADITWLIQQGNPQELLVPYWRVMQEKTSST
ncbi:hypothetical protein IWQ61_003924 [Dispira simplex]|nr:hypothetical protein IWQ61_003924 [Dispira simplex]